ncbi:MAG: hypothetical protein IPK16_27890 [Anaerolineales bacterium]|nr:hypothetical protein [Anaerolineales bacterium]
MAKYLLLYAGGAGMMLTEAERVAELERWGAWYGQLGAAVVDGGNPFAPAAKRVTADGRVVDGVAGAMATGYTIISADSLDQAAALAKGCPVINAGGEVTVYETFDVMM